MDKPEILAPIQDFVSLTAAIKAGCDAVYFGIKGFNMRAGAKNFSAQDLKKISKICKENNVKAYLALNTIIYEEEIKKVKVILEKAKKAKIDAIICWDMSVLRQAKRLKIPVHLSTQASVSNSEAAEFYRKQGVERIILARECSLKQIKDIQKNSKVDLEVFVHGAMCVSVSGRCFLSQYLFNRSANRGECLQPCRRKFLVKDIEEKHELELGEDYVLSPKDLCTLPFIERLIEANIRSFKIEGRNRSPEYVFTAVSAYRAAVDFYFAHKKKKGFKKNFEHLKKTLQNDLSSVYNRGFSSGFFLGKPIEEWSKVYGSKAKKKKVYIGKIVHFYNKINVAEIKIETKDLKIGDILMVQGPTTGVHKEKVSSMEMQHKKKKKAEKGDLVAVKLNTIARKNDKVFVIK